MQWAKFKILFVCCLELLNKTTTTKGSKDHHMLIGVHVSFGLMLQYSFQLNKKPYVCKPHSIQFFVNLKINDVNAIYNISKASAQHVRS